MLKGLTCLMRLFGKFCVKKYDSNNHHLLKYKFKKVKNVTTIHAQLDAFIT